MEVSRKRMDRSKLGLSLFIGLIVILLAVANFYFILRGVYGKFTADDLFPNTNDLHNLFTSRKQKIAILNSAYTQNLLPENSTWLQDNLNSWKKFTTNLNYEYELISDNFLETTSLQNFDLLILPGSKSLSDKEIIKIKQFLGQGGNVLATSGTASYSNDGKWRGWNFFSEVFGIRFHKEISNNEISKVHTLRGGQPLTSNIPAGYALKVATWDRPIAAEVLDPRTIQLSYWYDHKNEQGLVREEIKKSAGIVFGEYGKGRFVWMGFEINSVIGLVDDHIFLERLLKNSLNWLCRNPIAYVRDWPNNFNSAAVILPYLKSDFSSVSNLLQIVKSRQITPTFVVDASSINENNRSILTKLRTSGDIIPTIAFGNQVIVDDTIKNIFDSETQLQNLKKIKSSFELHTGKTINGVLAEYGLYDNSTIEALAKNNIDYLVSDSANGKSLPQKLTWNKNKITAMYRSSRDDYKVMYNLGLTDSVFQFYTYQEDIDRILFEGGLYFFKPHSNYQLLSSNIDVVGQVIDDLKSKNYWITSASEIAKWFKKRGDIEVGIKKMGKTRVRLTISNPSDDSAEKIEVDADLSRKAYNIMIASEIIGTRLPKFKQLNGGSLIRLTIDELKPHESRIYYIDYDTQDKIY